MAASSGDREVKPDGIPLRGIPIREIPRRVQQLPSWHGGRVEIKINITTLDHIYLFAHDTFTYSKWAVHVLQMAVRVIKIIQSINPKEAPMLKVLRVTGRVIKLIGGAVGVGGWASGLIDPAICAIVGGSAYILGDAVVLIGDVSDDGKLNNSFTLDEETAKPVAANTATSTNGKKN